MSATKFPDTTLTAKILADITECHQRVRPTFVTCWRQTKMSVLWVVEPTDTNPNIASQANIQMAVALALRLSIGVNLIKQVFSHLKLAF